MRNKILNSIVLGTLIYLSALNLDAQWSTNGSSIVYTTDKVGIGTSSPSVSLDVRNPYSELRIYSTGSSRKALLWSMNGSYSYGFGIGTDNKGHIYQNVNSPGIVMTFHKDNVGIGTSSPSYKLHVNGSFYSSSIMTNSITGSSFIDYNNSVWDRCDPSSTSFMYNIYYNQLNQFSDIRLKTNIVPIENSLNKLKELNAISYNYKNDSSFFLKSGNQKKIGFSAQEVQSVFPELVTEERGYLALNYVGLIPILTEAIKEQQNQIEELKITITNLSNFISQNNSMFPNPFENKINLDLALQSNVKKATLSIYDFNGKLVKQVEIRDRGNTLISFDTSELPVGVYTYNLIADGNLLSSSKMIKK